MLFLRTALAGKHIPLAHLLEHPTVVLKEGKARLFQSGACACVLRLCVHTCASLLALFAIFLLPSPACAAAFLETHDAT